MGGMMSISSVRVAQATGVVAAAAIIGGATYGARKLSDQLSGSPGSRPDGAMGFTGVAAAGTAAFAGLGSVMLADRGRTSQWAAAPALSSAAKFGAETLRTTAWAAIPIGLAAFIGVGLLD